jgi:chromatin remodeling complex protein RSC6
MLIRSHPSVTARSIALAIEKFDAPSAPFPRKHELQDPKEKRNIRADEKLLAVFDGKKVVSMFEMTKLVNGHLV